MNVLNIHKREVTADAEQVGKLLDSLASRKDLLFPFERWPRMIFDRPLAVGARGGHGPIRYFVEAYAPGRQATFRFTGPSGFDGYHQFEVLSLDEQSTLLRHTLKMRARGLALLSWPLIFRPLHDALLEDALAKAEAALGNTPTVVPWSPWVRGLRWVLTGGKARKQVVPRLRQPAEKAEDLIPDYQ